MQPPTNSLHLFVDFVSVKKIICRRMSKAFYNAVVLICPVLQVSNSRATTHQQHIVDWIGEIVIWLVFTALHAMQTRSSNENSVCPSVCWAVRHTRGLWQNGRKICPDLYTIRKNIYPSFLRRRMVGGGLPLLGKILGQPTPVGSKSPICNQ